MCVDKKEALSDDRRISDPPASHTHTSCKNCKWIDYNESEREEDNREKGKPAFRELRN